MIVSALFLLAVSKQEVNASVGKDIAPSSKIQLNINTRNAPVVHVTALPVDGEKWLRGLGTEQKRPQVSGAAVKTWDVTVASKGQHPNPNRADTYYSRQTNLPPMRPGVYLLTFKAATAEAWAVVNVTDLAVIVKRSPHHGLVWVTDFHTGRVVPGAQVAFFDRKGHPISRSETSSDGAVKVDLRPGEETVVVRHGADMAGVPTGAPDPDRKLTAHFQTDRPIYRPGQTIQFKSTLRRTLGQGYKVVAGQLCTVQLRDAKDNPLDEIKITSTPMGTVAGQFEIPQEGMTGAYSLILTNGKDTAYQTVTVAEYRKPEFKVDVKAQQRRYLAGEDLTFVVDSQYYFGAPVPQAEVRYQIRRSPLYFYGGSDEDRWFYSGDGNLYPRDTYSASPFVAEDVAYTDEKGQAVILVKSDPKAGDSTYSFSCTVTDSSRRQVQGSGSVPVYGAAVRLALSTRLVYASLGSLIPVDIRLVDLEGKPVAGTTVLEIHKQDWNQKKGEYVDRILTSTSVKVPTSGRYTMNLPAKEEGQLQISGQAPDGTGRTARAELSLWVSGNFEKPTKEKEQPKVGIMLDRRVYEAGAEAKALVTTNNPGHPLLITLEGGDVWDYKVVDGSRRSQTWTIPTSTRLSPNAFVEVAQWIKGQIVGANVILPVPDRSKILRVTATPDHTTYHPGDRATYTIHTADGTGKPVSAEVVLSVVDEAIYALSPDNTADLFSLYWGARGNQVTTHMSAPEELSGGAYQRSDAVAPLRQRFEDTAYWNPVVNTDASGDASVSFEMPGNLTSWRATARGVTMDTAVGMGRASVVANRPVMLRLATPRQIVQGDRVTLIATIDNRSESAHTFEVNLDAEGVALDGAAKQTIQVAAKTQSKVEWVLDAHDMPATGKAVLTGRIAATDDRNPDFGDALRVSVPVVPNGLPERQIAGGSIQKEAGMKFEMPADRIEPASVVTLNVRAGLRPAMQEAADEVLRNPRYGSLGAANQLDVAAATHLKNDAKQVKESLALLSRTQTNEGWGWWEKGPIDPVVTARVVTALGSARRAGIRVFDNLMKAAAESSINRYNATNLWEHRAQLAAATVATGDPRGKAEVEEVLARGKSMSPYARLKLAEALLILGDAKNAGAITDEVMALASTGPAETYLPAGEGTGWSASDTETTAQALLVLAMQNKDLDQQRRLAMWLTGPEQGWRSLDEDAAVVRALAQYLAPSDLLNQPDRDKLGEVRVTVNGQPVAVWPSKFAQAATALVPRELLRTGPNDIQITRTGVGEAQYTLESRVFRPATTESVEGVRVLRRFEVKNAGGTWVELDRPVNLGEPVRCTLVAWGDDIRDSVKVVEPLPAGFEYIEGESNDWGYQEIRDGAVIHFLTNSGSPQTFRYFIRAEAEGMLTALPATAEYLRRPAMHGRTQPLRIQVVEGPPPTKPIAGGVPPVEHRR